MRERLIHIECVEIVAQDLNKSIDRKTKIWIFFMKIGALTCHQIYERSFNFRGYQFPVCARCTGIFVGNIVGILLCIVKIKISLKICAVFILMMVYDGFLQLLKIKESNNIRRVITGFLAGIAYIFSLVNLISYFI